MRLFVAVPIPNDIRQVFERLLTELRCIAPSVKWVRAENLHVTLKFLGHTDAAKLGAIGAALQSVHSPKPVSLDFRGLGFFPNEKRPRVFWAGMVCSPNLPALAAEIDRVMHQAGFPLEERPFAPHLTLARFDPPGMPGALAPAVKRRAASCFGAVRAQEFHLIQSTLKSMGAEYTTLQSFPFVQEI